MTTLNEITQNFPTEAKNIFQSAYKQIVLKGLSDGLTVKQSNRIAFDILVKEQGIFKLI